METKTILLLVFVPIVLAAVGLAMWWGITRTTTTTTTTTTTLPPVIQDTGPQVAPPPPAETPAKVPPPAQPAGKPPRPQPQPQPKPADAPPPPPQQPMPPAPAVPPAAPVMGAITLKKLFSTNTPYIVDISPLNDGSNRVWLACKDGKIFIGDPKTGSSFTTFMSITDRVESQSEAGLYSIAPHPAYGSNGLFFIKYATKDGKIAIARGKSSGNTASPSTLQTVLTIDHVSKEQYHHYGGSDRFGPDGFLYITIGDTEARETAQNTKALQGKILRIDVGTAEKASYTVPPGNPFKNEVLHYGLRNPYSVHFSTDGALWISIVGDRREMVYRFDPNEAGKNIGWPETECAPGNCSGAIKPPVFAFEKDLGACIIGGCFYQGTVYPALKDCFIFAGFQFGGENPIYSWNKDTGKVNKIVTAGNAVSRITLHSDNTILVAVKSDLYVMA